LPHHRHLDGRVGHESRYREAHSVLVLLHLELAQHQLGRLIVSLGARDREDDDLVADLVLGPAPELEEASIGQLTSELMQDQRAGYMTFQHLERRDDGNGLRPAECVLAHVVRDHDAMDDHVDARDELPDGDGDDTRRRNRPGGQSQRADDEQQHERSSVASELAFSREASRHRSPLSFLVQGRESTRRGSARHGKDLQPLTFAGIPINLVTPMLSTRPNPPFHRFRPGWVPA
jgi:hypothetical protein